MGRGGESRVLRPPNMADAIVPCHCREPKLSNMSEPTRTEHLGLAGVGEESRGPSDIRGAEPMAPYSW